MAGNRNTGPAFGLADIPHVGDFVLTGSDRAVDIARANGQMELDDDERCDECGSIIPLVVGGSIANHHHAESCSLFEERECPHEWAFTGTAYGGDDESFRGEGRCYCVLCGADGDA